MLEAGLPIPDRKDPHSAVRYEAALVARSAGRKVIGIIGSAVPVELILAAGAFPLGLSARAEDFGQSAYPMESELEVEVQSLFRQAIGGDFAICDAIVIASTSDGYRYLFQYLTEMQRTGQSGALPAVRLYDFLLDDGSPVAAYNRKVVDAFTGWLEGLTGQSIPAAAIEAAINAVNPTRSLLSSIHDLRLQGRLSGSDARDAIAAGHVLDLEDHRKILSALTNPAAGSGTTSGLRVLVATSATLYHGKLHRLIEEAGGNVVAEDDFHGSRFLGPPIPPGGDPVSRLIAHYREHDSAPRQVAPRRDGWLRAMFAHEAIEGVVFYISPDDQSWGWRYPDLAECAREAGKRSLLLRDEVLSESGGAAIRSACAAWLTSFGNPVPA
jgi:benzoyl-CoA reductase/2-hydroxyglutaryl-CoA dehydratase subunit BcrC/BadD/HgdB